MWKDVSMDADYREAFSKLPPHDIREELLKMLREMIVDKKERLGRRDEFPRRVEDKVTNTFGEISPEKPPCEFEQGLGPTTNTSSNLNQGEIHIHPAKVEYYSLLSNELREDIESDLSFAIFIM
jgi:hypothetical protein